MSSKEQVIINSDVKKEGMNSYLKIALAIAAYAYLIAALVVDFEKALPVLIAYGVVHGFILLGFLGRKFAGRDNSGRMLENAVSGISNRILYSCYLVVFLIISVLCCLDDFSKLVSIGGLIVIVALAWAMSWNRSKIRWRPVAWGLGLQLVFALCILRSTPGFKAFNWLSDQVTAFVNFAKVGAYFLFGEELVDGTFAFFVLPTVIYFSGIVSLLYYFGVLQSIVQFLSKLMVNSLGTSPSESLSAAGNIFVGQTEAPLLVRPYIASMTRSELHAIMTGGFATIAGGVLAAFVSFGVPASALIAASVMSAPAALAISKIVYPETDKSDSEIGEVMDVEVDDASNAIEALGNGAILAIQLAANIAAVVLTFLAAIAVLNSWLGYLGGLVGINDLSFESICGVLFWPIAFVMGVPVKDCTNVARLIGLKIFTNEFVGYLEMIKLRSNSELSDKAFIIASYALCGFANFGSIGIQLGGLIPLAPKRRTDLSELVMSAMIAGNLACFMTATIAGFVTPVDQF